MSEWVHVKDRLPTEEGLYLVYRYGEVKICNFTLNPLDATPFDWANWYSFERDISGDYDNIVVCGVTHWMPLPERP